MKRVTVESMDKGNIGILRDMLEKGLDAAGNGDGGGGGQAQE